MAGQGCKDVNECVLWVITQLISLALSQRRGVYSCACPGGFVSVAEDGKPHGRIEMCGVVPIGDHASRRTLENYHGRAIRCTFDAGHTVHDGVLDAPTEWAVRCDASVSFSTGHACHQVSPTLNILTHNTSTMCLCPRRGG